MVGVLIGWHILAIGLLLWIGSIWLALIPSIILVVLLGYGFSARQISSWKQEGQYLLRRFLLVGARSMICIGIRSLGDIVGVPRQRAGMLVLFHTILWLGSYAIRYEDGVSLFHRGHYLSSGLVFISIGGLVESRSTIVEMVAVRGWMMIGIYAFIVFVLGAMGYRVSDLISKLLYGLLLGEILYAVMVQAGHNRMIAVLLLMLALVLYVWLVHTRMETAELPYEHIDEDEDEFYKALYGSHDPHVKHATPVRTSGLLEKRGIDDLAREHHELIAMSIAVMMTLTMGITILRVLDGVSGANILSLYAIVFTYIAGRLITRHWSTIRHRGRWISLIGILCVSYVTIDHRLGTEIITLVLAGLVVSLGLSGFLLYDARYTDQPLFDGDDRRAWLVGVVGLTIMCGGVFLRLPLSAQFIFALLCMYGGVQGMMIWYIWKADNEG